MFTEEKENISFKFAFAERIESIKEIIRKAIYNCINACQKLLFIVLYSNFIEFYLCFMIWIGKTFAILDWIGFKKKNSHHNKQSVRNSNNLRITYVPSFVKIETVYSFSLICIGSTLRRSTPPYLSYIIHKTNALKDCFFIYREYIGLNS